MNETFRVNCGRSFSMRRVLEMTLLAFEVWMKRRRVGAPDDGEATGGCLTHEVL